MKNLILALALLATVNFPASAEDHHSGNERHPPGGEGHRHGPPPESLAACKGKAADSACNFKGKEGQGISGKCFSPDDSKPLACRPEHHGGERPKGGEHRQGPPPESLEACKGKAADTACSFKGRHGHNMTGKCFTPEASKPMACRPDHHPGDGHEHGN